MANDTISQIKIADTTYDICDAKTRNSLQNLVYYYDKMTILSSSSAMSVNQNQETSIGYLMVEDPTGTEWGKYITCPAIYHLLIHSTGAARFQRLVLKTSLDESVYHVTNNYINQTYDVISSMSGVLSFGVSSYRLYINSTAALTNVYGNISWIAFKTT